MLPPDPFGTFLQVAPEVWEQFQRFRARAEVRQLFRLLKAELDGRPGFPWDQVRRLALDPTMQGLLLRVLQEHQIDEPALHRRLVELCDPGGYKATREEFADEVLTAIRRNAHRAVASDRDAMKHVARVEADRVAATQDDRYGEILARLDEVLEREDATAPRPAQPNVDNLLDLVVAPIAPDLASIIGELKLADPHDAAMLASHVQDVPARAAELARAPQPWALPGTPALWSAIGDIAVAAGEWSSAQQAYERAEQLPGADRVWLLMRAHDCADADSRHEDAAALFQRAREIDPRSVLVRLVEIRELNDSRTQLGELDQLAPRTAREERAVCLARVDVLGTSRDFSSALALLDGLLATKSDDLAALDRAAGLAILREHGVLASGREPDRNALRNAARRSLDLRRRLRGRGRDAETAGLLARAAKAWGLAGDIRRARSLVSQEPSAGELASKSGRRALADAAMVARLPDRAVEILGDEREWEVADRCLASHALALSASPEANRRGYEMAVDLFAIDSARQQAAFALLAAAMGDPELPWNEDAQAVVAATTPALAAHMHAERLEAEGRSEEAEQSLLRFTDDLETLRALVDRALQQERWTRALALAERLVTQTGRGEDRLRRVHALKNLKQQARLLGELQALSRDPEQPEQIRARAYAALSQEVAASDFAELARLAEGWLNVSPYDEDAVWQLVYAYGRLTRYPEALAALEAHHIEPHTLQQAYVAAVIYRRALPPVEAARRISELSDLFDRSDDRLESMVIMAAAAPSREKAGPELEARIAESYRLFTDVFQDSKYIQTVEFDSPEQFIERLREESSEYEQLRRKVNDDLMRGHAPLASLAAASGRNLVEITARLHALPLGYSEADQAGAELASAERALGGGAVWDPVSLTTIALMPAQIQAALVAALPGSVIAASTLTECDLADANTPDGNSSEMIGPEGLIVIPPEVVARERRLAKTALALAQGFTPYADVDPQTPDELDALLSEGDEGPDLSVRTWIATASVARRTGLPLFSDDRFVRLEAVRNGIETFGTDALLSAAHERGLLDQQMYAAARRNLLERGAFGLRPTVEEIRDLASEAEWEPVGGWPQALIDPLAWQRNLAGQLRLTVQLLIAVHSEAPEKLDAWTARALDCISTALPRVDFDLLAISLLGSAWSSDLGAPSASVDFGRSIFRAVEQAPVQIGRRPVAGLATRAVDLLLSGLPQEPRELRPFLFKRLVRRLPYKEQFEVVMNLVRP